MEKMNNNNTGIINTVLEKLRHDCPECFDRNGAFNFEKFRHMITAAGADFSKESYSLEWLGKSYARLLATDETKTLLRENKAFNERPKNAESHNLLIKGDNLDVLKHLVNAYREQVKMVYIDPPYNTGNDGFVYRDDRRFSVPELSRLAGIDEERAKRILDFVQSGSNSHSAWLTFMYPRLYIARHLLREDGVIFVSIDDNEVAQLRILMDEIFGEENFIAAIMPIVNPGGRDYKQVAVTHEYLLVYGKTESTELNEIDKNTDFVLRDESGGFELRELRNRNPKFNQENRPNLFYPIYINPNLCDKHGFCAISLTKSEEYSIEIYPYNSQGKTSVWRWSRDKLIENIISQDPEKSQVIAKQKRDGNWNICEKNRKSTTKVKSVWSETVMRTEEGTREIRALFGETVFNHPKPTGLIKKILKIGCNNNSLILDFFAGSGTTGEAVMQLNAEDGGKRRYILVQLPEPIDLKKNKTAYDFVKNELGVEEPTIFDITRERLIRAARKIRDEHPESDFDAGFKIFETVPVPEGYCAAIEAPSEEATLFDPENLSEEQIEALLLTWKTYDGVPLDEEPKVMDLDGYGAYAAGSKLYLMDAGFTTDHLKALLEKMDEDADFTPNAVIAFGYRFESKMLRELAENLKAYDYKKGGGDSIEFVVRY